MCLGGHLAFRCALDPRVHAAVCYFATDIHSNSLGAGGDDSLVRAGEIKGELVMVNPNSFLMKGYFETRGEFEAYKPADLRQEGQPCPTRRKGPYTKDLA